MATHTNLDDGGKVIDLSLSDIAVLTGLPVSDLNMDSGRLVIASARVLTTSFGRASGVRISLFKRGWDRKPDDH